MTDTPPTDGQVRPLAAILQDLRRGEVLDEAAVKLQALVKAVIETRKKGKLVLTLELAPTKGTDALTVSAAVKDTVPTAPPAAALFFSDKGNLVRDDPRQAALPGLRIAPSSTSETVKDIAQ